MGAMALLTSGWNFIKMGFSVLGKFLGSLNSQGVAGLIVALVLSAVAVHQWSIARHWHKQSDQNAKLYQRELDHDAKIAKQAVDLKTKIDGLTINISHLLKEQNDAQNARIHSAADDLRMRGPGKAACPGNPGFAAAPGRSQQPAGTGNAAVAQVRDSGGISLIALPFADTVDFGEEHDRYRTEAMTWREWYKRLTEIWPKPDQGRK
jgi:hypothetical protein